MTKAEVGKIAAWIRKSSAILLVGGVTLIFTRNPGLAIMAGMIAYAVMARTGWYPGKGRGGSSANSVVRTPYLEMALDHATGAISGRVLQGRFAGRAFSDFTNAERTDFLAELRSNDAQGAQLFEAYLDRAFPGWNAGGGDSGPRARTTSRGMTVDEAYLVLGLSRGATREDVQTAHRNLMKRFHPDQGGSTYLASQVNEAKDVLLKHIKA
jgi:DnaJ-like protein